MKPVVVSGILYTYNTAYSSGSILRTSGSQSLCFVIIKKMCIYENKNNTNLNDENYLQHKLRYIQFEL